MVSDCFKNESNAVFGVFLQKRFRLCLLLTLYCKDIV